VRGHRGTVVVVVVELVVVELGVVELVVVSITVEEVVVRVGWAESSTEETDLATAVPPATVRRPITVTVRRWNRGEIPIMPIVGLVRAPS